MSTAAATSNFGDVLTIASTAKLLSVCLRSSRTSCCRTPRCNLRHGVPTVPTFGIRRRETCGRKHAGAQLCNGAPASTGHYTLSVTTGTFHRGGLHSGRGHGECMPVFHLTTASYVIVILSSVVFFTDAAIVDLTLAYQGSLFQ